MTKIQSASGGSNVSKIEYWNLEFICNLGIVIWCFRIWLEFIIFKDTNIFR
jgi:hypothetical protein